MVGEGIARQVGDNLFELYSWFFMRLSGIILAVMVIAHLFLLHFVVGVATIDYHVIVWRWAGPQGALFRIYDMIMLILAFTHGANGIRFVIEDYIHSDSGRTFWKAALYVTYFVILALGIYIIFSFNPDENVVKCSIQYVAEHHAGDKAWIAACLGK
jgi:succinate dehydrogenase / fumarate reductase membrane anchor subunit